MLKTNTVVILFFSLLVWSQHRTVLYHQLLDALSYSQIKSWRVTGFEAAVALQATASCQEPELLSAAGTLPGVLSAFHEKRKCRVWPQTISPTFLLRNTWLLLTALPELSVHCLPWLFCQLVNVPVSLCLASKKKKTSVLVFLSVTVKIFLFEDLSGGCCLTHRSSFWSESELNECMFNLIIDSAAGLTTKPRGADNSSINLFSLATAPPVCVKIVFHLIRTQYSSCISITEVRESALLILRCWPPPWVSLWPVTTLGTDQIVSHKLVGHSKNNSASSSHSFTTFIVDRANPKN